MVPQTKKSVAEAMRKGGAPAIKKEKNLKNLVHWYKWTVHNLKEKIAGKHTEGG